MSEEREHWALILGASSGFGAATSLALARCGFNIFGVHLDRNSTIAHAERVKEEIEATGQGAMFFNVNAANPEKRCEVIASVQETLRQSVGNPSVEVLLHSLAFGTLKPFIAEKRDDVIDQPHMDMTLDVMAHSLVYWVQDLIFAGLMRRGAKIFAMTSSGGRRVWPHYGAVSAAKAALESHIRQLAVELAPMGIAANAIRAGVTDTPALRKIPGHEALMEFGLTKNPHGRVTTPEDVAAAICALACGDTHWITGNVIGADGGEDIAG